MGATVAAVARDVVGMVCVTALAIAHIIPGSTAVALLAPYLALRALSHLRPGPPGGGGASGAGELEAGPAPASERRPPRARHRARTVLEALVLATLRLVDPLADLATLAHLDVTLAELGERVRRGLAGVRHLAPAMLLALAVLALPGCEALAPFLAPAAAAAGAGLGAYESQITAAASAKGIPSSDPRVLSAIANARQLAEQRAREDLARDQAARVQLEALKASLDARPACPPAAPPAPPPTLPQAPAVLPVVVRDAGAPEGR
jgi:hypothetical protein